MARLDFDEARRIRAEEGGRRAIIDRPYDEDEDRIHELVAWANERTVKT